MPEFKDYLMEALYNPTPDQQKAWADRGRTLLDAPVDMNTMGHWAGIVGHGLGKVMGGLNMNLALSGGANRDRANNQIDAIAFANRYAKPKDAVLSELAGEPVPTRPTIVDNQPPKKVARAVPQPPAQIGALPNGDLPLQESELRAARARAAEAGTKFTPEQDQKFEAYIQDGIVKGQVVPSTPQPTAQPAIGAQPTPIQTPQQSIAPIPQSQIPPGTAIVQPGHDRILTNLPPDVTPELLMQAARFKTPEQMKEFLKDIHDQSKVVTQPYGAGEVQTRPGQQGATLIPGKPIVNSIGQGSVPVVMSPNATNTGYTGVSPKEIEQLAPAANTAATVLENAKNTGSNIGKENEAYIGEVVEAYKAGQPARNLKQLLSTISPAKDWSGFNQGIKGPYGQKLSEFSKLVNDFLPGANIIQSNGTVALNDAFKGIGAQLAAENARGLTNRPTQFDFQTFLNSKPGFMNSNEGFEMIIDYMKQKADFDDKLSRIASKHFTSPKEYAAERDKLIAENPIVLKYKGKTIQEWAKEEAEKDAASKNAPMPGSSKNQRKARPGYAVEPMQ